MARNISGRHAHLGMLGGLVHGDLHSLPGVQYSISGGTAQRPARIIYTEHCNPHLYNICVTPHILLDHGLAYSYAIIEISSWGQRLVHYHT